MLWVKSISVIFLRITEVYRLIFWRVQKRLKFPLGITVYAAGYFLCNLGTSMYRPILFNLLKTTSVLNVIFYALIFRTWNELYHRSKWVTFHPLNSNVTNCKCQRIYPLYWAITIASGDYRHLYIRKSS